MPEPGDYEELTVAELKDLAKDADLDGYSTLNKEDLCEFLAENDVLLPLEDEEDLEPIDEDEIETDEVLKDPDDEQDEEEADPETDEEELQEVRIHAGHPSAHEFLDDHLDHEVRDYKRYTVEIPQDDLDDLLEDPGQPFVTPLA